MDGFSLRVITYNIAGERVDLHRLRDVLHQYRPDLICLQEVIRRRHVHWLGDHLDLPHWHYAPPQSGRKGVALLSRWPLGPAHTLYFQHGAQGKAALAAPIVVPVGSIWVCTVHLDSPPRRERGRSPWRWMAFLGREVFGQNRRYLEAQELCRWLQQLKCAPWIVGGDFNSLSFSRANRHMSRMFIDALSSRPWRYLNGTFRPPGLPCLIRIDYIYHTPGLPLHEARVLPSSVSDHASILAVFTWPKAMERSPGDRAFYDGQC